MASTFFDTASWVRLNQLRKKMVAILTLISSCHLRENNACFVFGVCPCTFRTKRDEKSNLPVVLLADFMIISIKYKNVHLLYLYAFL